jgi:hypothetical protein
MFDLRGPICHKLNGALNRHPSFPLRERVLRNKVPLAILVGRELLSHESAGFRALFCVTTRES